jgi:hypothetical protein
MLFCTGVQGTPGDDVPKKDEAPIASVGHQFLAGEEVEDPGVAERRCGMWVRMPGGRGYLAMGL